MGASPKNNKLLRRVPAIGIEAAEVEPVWPTGWAQADAVGTGSEHGMVERRRDAAPLQIVDSEIHRTLPRKDEANRPSVVQGVGRERSKEQ